jgi:hypothetical protein
MLEGHAELGAVAPAFHSGPSPTNEASGRVDPVSYPLSRKAVSNANLIFGRGLNSSFHNSGQCVVSPSPAAAFSSRNEPKFCNVSAISFG